MTIIDLEDFLNKVRGNLLHLTFSEAEEMVDQIKQYGMDLKITDELVEAYNSDKLKEYIEATQI